MLKGPKTTASSLQYLYSEMYRVLQPGGHILLYEITPGLNFKKEHPIYGSRKSQRLIRTFKEETFASLVAAGFASITIKPGSEIKGVEYLFDPYRRFAAY